MGNQMMGEEEWSLAVVWMCLVLVGGAQTSYDLNLLINGPRLAPEQKTCFISHILFLQMKCNIFLIFIILLILITSEVTQTTENRMDSKDIFALCSKRLMNIQSRQSI